MPDETVGLTERLAVAAAKTAYPSWKHLLDFEGVAEIESFF